ncbi:MAG: D-2-hydroxyacid dehydrogenase family protein [Rubrimonas sp.]
MLRIAVLDDYQQVAAGLADWASVGAADFFHAPIPAAELAATLRPYDVACLMRERTPFPAALIDALPNLKLIVTTGGRNASIDVAAAAARGVPVCGTASRAPATAQAAMTLILAASRNLAPEAMSMRDGGWQVGLGRDLHGLTLGLIGLGRLGAAVADLARPFGVKLIAWSANLTDDRCAEVGVERAATLRALLTTADVASIHMVLSDRTRGLIGPEQLSWMKPDALLVNTSRGPIVDSAALIEALRRGRPGAAALDVYDHEPLPADHFLRDRALIDAGRLLLTPHIGYVARQTYEVFYRETVECIAAWAAGAPVRRIA